MGKFHFQSTKANFFFLWGGKGGGKGRKWKEILPKGKIIKQFKHFCFGCLEMKFVHWKNLKYIKFQGGVALKKTFKIKFPFISSLSPLPLKKKMKNFPLKNFQKNPSNLKGNNFPFKNFQIKIYKKRTIPPPPLV